MGQQINDSGLFSGEKIVDVSGVHPPITVALYPGGGNTSRWEYSATPGAAELNAIFTGLASGVTGQTIDITGNFGAADAACDRSIATLKGWTVVG